MNTVFEYTNTLDLQKAMFCNGDVAERVRNIIASELGKARGRLSKDAKGVIGNDPRDAYKAVKRSVYRQILGGNLSILSKKRAGKTRVAVVRERAEVVDKNGQHRGGNRRTRSARTDQVDSYYGSDRGFILRFLNDGTYKSPQRETRYGNRGSIAARNWFQRMSEKEMVVAVNSIFDLVDKEIDRALSV